MSYIHIETGSENGELDELRESLRKVKEMNQTVTRLKSGVGEFQF